MSLPDRTLRPQQSTSSLLKKCLLLAVSILFVACGVWMLPEKALTGSFIIAFFGLCALVFVVQLLPGSTWLKLDARGFTYCSLFRKHRVRWQDVESFVPVRMGPNDLVGWTWAENYKGTRGGSELSRRLAGVDAALPDNYGKSAGGLAQLMNSYNSRTR
ncbi:STM3941 family protein [Dokdonella sp.]|uniref:STM3941 family protein n=1 Tax=Dokdonella sp. TaxID=2291710 RepID=UPI003528B0FF